MKHLQISQMQSDVRCISKQLPANVRLSSCSASLLSGNRGLHFFIIRSLLEIYMFCSKCGKENKENAKFCTHCGTPINLSETSHPQINAHVAAQPTLTESEIKNLKKKILNAGTSAVALGWFSIAIAPILLTVTSSLENNLSDALVLLWFPIVILVGVGALYVKYGKKFNKVVNAESDKAMRVLFWVSLALVFGLPLFGATPGILVVILVFYLFSARKALKKLADAGMLTADLILKS